MDKNGTRGGKSPVDDLVITFRPDATPEEEDEFLSEFAHAILSVARYVVNRQIEAEGGEAEPDDELNFYVRPYTGSYKKRESI